MKEEKDKDRNRNRGETEACTKRSAQRRALAALHSTCQEGEVRPRKSPLSQRAAAAVPPGLRRLQGNTWHSRPRQTLSRPMTADIPEPPDRRKGGTRGASAEQRAERLAAVCPSSHTNTQLSACAELSLLTSAAFSSVCQCGHHASSSSPPAFVFLLPPPLLSSLLLPLRLPFFFSFKTLL